MANTVKRRAPIGPAFSVPPLAKGVPKSLTHFPTAPVSESISTQSRCPLVASRVARWVTVCDGTTLLLAGIAINIAVVGGIQVSVRPVRLSMHSVWEVLGAAAILTIFRHLLAPEPSLVRRVRRAADAVVNRASRRYVRDAFASWLTFRLGVVAVGLLAMGAIGVAEPARPLQLADRPLLDLASRWDANWYVQIAVDGYVWRPAGSGSQQNIAFFPGYPLLVHVGGAMLGARVKPAPLRHIARERVWHRTLLAAWLIALAASLLSLMALHTWTLNVAGAVAAARSVVLMSAYPFAFFHSAAYTESLFTLAAVSAFNSFAAQRPMSAASWGFLAGLTRPNGFLLAVPFAVLAARAGRTGPRLWLAAAAPVAGLALFSAYIWHLTGRPFAWAEAHAAWGRTPMTWNAATSSFDALATVGVFSFATSRPFDVLNALAALFAIGLLPVVWRRLGLAATLFVAVSLAPPLAFGGLMSIGRLTSTLFPLFVALALVVPRRHLVLWVGGFAVFQGLAAAMFFTWRPIV